MKQKYTPTIGLEIHVQLKNNTKMFSSGPVTFGNEPNTSVTPMDLGYPGTMPRVNKSSVRAAIMVCNALNMNIDPLIRFDRKNYFYPDLPKGYQITQQFFPIGKNGFLDIKLDDNQLFRITIERLHMEEDTAKKTKVLNEWYLDYNRAGITLLEIVTNPIMHTAEHAIKYIKKLRQILLFLNVSDVKMNEGSLRCDVNISLSNNNNVLGSKVEIKNINSISNIETAIKYEIKRQAKLLSEGSKINSQTRRFDDKTDTTVLMREKTSISDYKYFPEPNIMPIKLQNKWIKHVIDNMPMLPENIRILWKKKYNLDDKVISKLLVNPETTTFFEAAMKDNINGNAIANLITNDIFAFCKLNKLESIKQVKLEPKELSKLISYKNNGKISNSQAKKILQQLLNIPSSVDQIIKDQNITQINDENALDKIIRNLVNKNPEMINQYSTRPERVLKFFIGQTMKETRGQANPVIVKDLFEKILKDYK